MEAGERKAVAKVCVWYLVFAFASVLLIQLCVYFQVFVLLSEGLAVAYPYRYQTPMLWLFQDHIFDLVLL